LVLLNEWALAKLLVFIVNKQEIVERLKVREHCYLLGQIKMEKVAKVLVILTMLLLVFSSDVEGGRQLKSKEENVEHPQTFLGNGGGLGGVGGLIPSPGFGGVAGSGPPSFCAIFPAGCVPGLPTIPSGSIGVGTPSIGVGTPARKN
jgi:hypothetical protein